MSEINRHTPIEALPEYLRVDECARFLGIGKGLVYELIRRGEIPARSFGRIIRVRRDGLANMQTNGGGR